MPDTLTQDEVETALGVDRRGARRQTLKHWRVFAIAAGLLAVSLFVLTRIFGAPPPPAFTTAEATRGRLIVTVSATGDLQPVNEVDVGIEVSGTIAEALVDHNDRVAAGDVLARLDTSVLEAEAEQSRAALAAARASLSLAQATETETRIDLDRLESLRERSTIGLPTDRDLDRARAAHDRAAATVAAEQARIREIGARIRVNDVQLGKAVVTSPIDGVVLSRLVDPGQTVAAALQTPKLFVLAEDLAEMELHVDVDEADVGNVAEGQAAAFTVDAFPNETFPARITQVRLAPSEGAGVVTYEAILTVDNAGLRLRPGMTATAEITVDEIENALLIPNEALRFAPLEDEGEGGGGFAGAFVPRIPDAPERDANLGRSAEKRIWILKDKEPREISITVGATDGRFTQVVGGDLTEGLGVIVDQAEPT